MSKDYFEIKLNFHAFYHYHNIVLQHTLISLHSLPHTNPYIFISLHAGPHVHLQPITQTTNVASICAANTLAGVEHKTTLPQHHPVSSPGGHGRLFLVLQDGLALHASLKSVLRVLGEEFPRNLQSSKVARMLARGK